MQLPASAETRTVAVLGMGSAGAWLAAGIAGTDILFTSAVTTTLCWWGWDKWTFLHVGVQMQGFILQAFTLVLKSGTPGSTAVGISASMGEQS